MNKMQIYGERFKLIEPTKITNARYKYTEQEENIFILIIDALQLHMSKVKYLDSDLFGCPMITIDVNEIYEKAKKLDYVKASKALMKKEIAFEWKHKDFKGTIETTTSLIDSIHNFRNTSTIQLTLKMWAIPYLIHCGEGFTKYDKKIALLLRGEYTKRFYKLCKKWENKGGFTMSLQELRNTFQLEDKYPLIADFKKRILEPAKEKLKANADVYFNYSLEKRDSPSFNYITFRVVPNNANKPVKEKTDIYGTVYFVITLAYPNTKSNKAQRIADEIAQNPDKLEQLYKRFKRLKNEFLAKERELKDTIPLVIYILKNDYNIKI